MQIIVAICHETVTAPSLWGTSEDSSSASSGSHSRQTWCKIQNEIMINSEVFGEIQTEIKRNSEDILCNSHTHCNTVYEYD